MKKSLTLLITAPLLCSTTVNAGVLSRGNPSTEQKTDITDVPTPANHVSREAYNKSRLEDKQWQKDGGWSKTHKPSNVGNLKSKAGLVDKVNAVSVSATNAYDHADDAYGSAERAHNRLDHQNDRIKAHSKSIGNLYQQKVDTETFRVDQKRQDDQLQKEAQSRSDGDVNTLKQSQSYTDVQVAPVAQKTQENSRGIYQNSAAIQDHEERLSNLESDYSGLSNRIDDNRNEARSGVAVALAASSVPQSVKADTSSIGVGTGNFKSHSAVAVGYSYRFSDDATTLKAAVGVSDRNTGWNAGISHEF